MTHRVKVTLSHLPYSFKLRLYNSEELMGMIMVFEYPNWEHNAILHIHIREKYRKRWLTSVKLINSILKSLIAGSIAKDIKFIHSFAGQPISPRMFRLFKFEVYPDDERFYKLKINRYKNEYKNKN